MRVPNTTPPALRGPGQRPPSVPWRAVSRRGAPRSLGAGARRGALLVVVVGTLALGLTACGAEGDVAPRGAPPPSCPHLDGYLAGVYDLLDQGKLQHLAALLGGSLTPDAQSDLVAAGVRLATAMEPGSFAALDVPAASGAGAASLEDLGAALLRWVIADGPGAPYAPALEAARRTVSTCQGPPVLALARAVLGDEELLRALLDLAGRLPDTGAAALDGLRFDGEQGRAAAHALARNVLVLAASPDLSPEELVDLLGVVVDVTAPPWDALSAALMTLLGDPALRADVAALSSCYRDADPGLALVDVLVDLVSHPGPLRQPLSRLPALPAARPGRPALPPWLAQPLDAVLLALERDAPARRALGAVLGAALDPAQAVGVLGDLAELLQAHVLGDVVAALQALATRRCDP